MSKVKTVRIAADSDGMIGAVAMVVALVKSGCPLEENGIYRSMTEAEREQVRAALA